MPAGEQVVDGVYRTPINVSLTPIAVSTAIPQMPSQRKAVAKKPATKKPATKKPVIKKPVVAAVKPTYVASPLPLSSEQIASIDAMQRSANEAALSARAAFDEGTATAGLNRQMSETELRRQQALATRTGAMRAASRGSVLSPAVLARVAAGLQEQRDRSAASIGSDYSTRITDLTRAFQRAQGQFSSDMSARNMQEARYRANPAGLMGWS